MDTNMNFDLSAKEIAELLGEVSAWTRATSRPKEVLVAKYPDQEKVSGNPSFPSVSVALSLATSTSPSKPKGRVIGTYTREENQRGAAAAAAGKRDRVAKRIEATLPDWTVGREKFVASDYIKATFPNRCVKTFRRTYRDLLMAVLAKAAPVLAQKWLDLRSLIRKAMALKRGVGYVAGRILAEWAEIGRRMGSHPNTLSKRFAGHWLADLRGWYAHPH
jgi:hypothetical protein